ncbi:hypothetical protein Poli38472_007025 [Pythium oligandrum]|uniref:Uncharacterized protein n=1 Tax=Pythium oligandrum TaxID=41045 RepID=A0A8K1C9R0_PYTOL|nr:hypothetical protein Poli38472_007025 [Pythium oligandrum]|eukprot:TMW58880.1 hypothetical protein Poli38472_007025 [Pythium oligandrum]
MFGALARFARICESRDGKSIARSREGLEATFEMLDGIPRLAVHQIDVDPTDILTKVSALYPMEDIVLLASKIHDINWAHWAPGADKLMVLDSHRPYTAFEVRFTSLAAGRIYAETQMRIDPHKPATTDETVSRWGE